MSDALAYLAKTRPDAIGPCFQFLKAAGSKLDPKTRNLISVITKVHAQTERGLRQYLTRALREGCSAEEVLDAMLMAFPALGLAKIVWAVDIILAMDLPAFQPGAMGAGEWHELMPTKGFAVGRTARIECDGRALFVHRAEDGWRVYDSRCPHQATDIPELALEIDLFGQVVADSIAGVQHSGIGGHEDFLAGAGLIADGRSLLCLPSTVTVRGETRSRVAPKLAAGSIVTSPRHQVDVVVTEHGIAELAGRTVGERAHLLAGIAHPDFRDELFEAARTIDRLGVR